MRLIGHVSNEPHARTFGNYLYSQGVENQLDFQKGDGWGVWVMDEDKLQQAQQMLSSFLQNPADARYASQAKAADELRARKEKEQQNWQKRLKERRHLFRPLTAYGVGPLTFLLIAVSVVVFFLSQFGQHPDRILSLYISLNPITKSLPEVQSGQLWRLVTPIFIHGDILHIFFNMLWLRDLGSMIEARQSTLQLLLLAAVIAIGSNLAQYFYHGPAFGGMSGVVYGLLGYIWIRGRFDPGSGLFVHPSNVTMMLIWLVLCFIGVIPRVANAAHIAGLAIGGAWGYLASLRYR